MNNNFDPKNCRYSSDYSLEEKKNNSKIPKTQAEYALEVKKLEDEGLTTSDAQGEVDARLMSAGYDVNTLKKVDKKLEKNSDETDYALRGLLEQWKGQVWEVVKRMQNMRSKDPKVEKAYRSIESKADSACKELSAIVFYIEEENYLRSKSKGK